MCSFICSCRLNVVFIWVHLFLNHGNTVHSSRLEAGGGTMKVKYHNYMTDFDRAQTTRLCD